MNKYQSRWTCNNCSRKISQKLSPPGDMCNRCKSKIKKPNLYSLNKIPQQYFEFEKLKVEGIKLEA